MSHFEVRLQIGNPETREFADISTLVDTGATYTWVPAPVLESLGIRPEEQREFILANSERVTYGIATALVRLDDRIKPTQVVFGDPDSDALLGVVTLEEFGLGVDALNEQLVPTPGLLKGYRQPGVRMPPTDKK